MCQFKRQTIIFETFTCFHFETSSNKPCPLYGQISVSTTTYEKPHTIRIFRLTRRYWATDKRTKKSGKFSAYQQIIIDKTIRISARKHVF